MRLSFCKTKEEFRMRLKSKVAIITGAAYGIGQGIAQAVAREGASVVIADINMEGSEKTARDICKSGSKALAMKVDISKEAEVKNMIERTISQFGRVDILVNNAAFLGSSYHQKPFVDTQVSEWRAEIDVTFIGTLLCCHAVTSHMLKQKSGRIINISSDAGKMGIPKMAIYSACKGAMAGFSRALAQELAPEGITVNCISPGPIETPTVTAILKKMPGQREAWVANVPMRRLGEPADIASMVVFLASDEASYITGQDYSVDGGSRM
jgi:2-hydroxycyclohexanecarboxyl-CoA dehydrogenase